MVPVTYFPLGPFLQSFICHCISGSKECIKSGSWGMVLAMHCFLQDTIGTGLPSAAGVILGKAEVWSVCGHPSTVHHFLKNVNTCPDKRTLSDLSVFPSYWLPCPNFLKQHPLSPSVGSYFFPLTLSYYMTFCVFVTYCPFPPLHPTT